MPGDCYDCTSTPGGVCRAHTVTGKSCGQCAQPIADGELFVIPPEGPPRHLRCPATAQPAVPPMLMTEVELALQRRRAGTHEQYVAEVQLGIRRALLIENIAACIAEVQTIDKQRAEKKERMS